MMLARVTFDLETVADLGDDPRTTRARWRELARVLQRHGVLVSNQDWQTLYRAAMELSDPSASQFWSDVIYNLPVQKLTPPRRPVEALGSLDDVCNEWADAVDVAVTELVYAECLGLPADKATWQDPDSLLELVPLSFVNQSLHFQVLRHLSETPIGRGETRDQVWMRRLAPLLCRTHTLSICDRYAGKELVKAADHDKCGLGWLLRRCGTNGPRYVNIITGFGMHPGDMPETRVLDSLQELARSLRGNGIREITLFTVHDRHFSKESHDRFLRCRLHPTRGCNHILELPRGLAVLAKARVVQESAFQYRTSDEMPEREKQLRSKKPDPVVVRPDESRR